MKKAKVKSRFSISLKSAGAGSPSGPEIMARLNALSRWFLIPAASPQCCAERFHLFGVELKKTPEAPPPSNEAEPRRKDNIVSRKGTAQQFGASSDQPVTADYDGDGKSDVAIYRPGPREWWLLRSTAGMIAFQFGNSGDKTVPGDYTGDGKADVAFWRPTTGEWFVLRSEDSSFFSFPFGTTGDVPSPGDYDGDGKFDATVFRPSTNTWFANRSTAGVLIQPFGIAGDRSVPNAFVR